MSTVLVKEMEQLQFHGWIDFEIFSFPFLRYEELMKKKVLEEKEKQKVYIGFETKMRQKMHTHCKCCRRVRLKHTICSNGVCGACKKHKDVDYFLRNNALPVWYENGDKRNPPNYHVPLELQNLTLAEKMLIQRISPFVALQHVRNGVMGLKGHVCAFEQKIDGLASQLPRPANDVNIICVEQLVLSEVGGDNFHRKSFKVHRSKVITALYWLKQHNPEYFDIEIDESNLEWIGESDAGYLDVKSVPMPENPGGIEQDLGPTPDSAVTAEHDVSASTGYIDNGGPGVLSPEDSEMNEELQSTVAASDNRSNVHTPWPTISTEAVNEYSDTKIFARAFPWLFPGGFGDPKDFPQSLGDWGTLMLFYEDTRFAVDKIFTFFALNYIVRHRNSTSGGFFIDKFQRDCPETLEDLKKQIQKGDTSFVNSLTYYNKRVKGSNAYWLQKRSEVYAWVNHHVEVRNGAPMFFMTLSCAEHYWADVALMLKDRLDQAGLDSSKCRVGKPGFAQIVNDYTVVVQEYFQERVTEWLDSVGKAIFGIEHCWIRYEFAPGRGQIHAHLLAIAEDQEIYQIAHDVKKKGSKDDPHTQATVFADWASKKFGLTASVQEGFDDIDLDKGEMPTSVRFMDLEKKSEIYREDIQRLLKAVQCHICSGFCMRDGKGKE